MKSLLLLLIATSSSLLACSQTDKSKRPSPPAIAKETLANGTNVSIDYSQPSVKGRTVGKEVEPFMEQVWRAGANEATVFTIDKDVEIDGKKLPAGKYGLFAIMHANNWTIIFNKTWNQWGAFKYKESEDALRINAEEKKAEPFAERLTYTISKDGKVSLSWGDLLVEFVVK